MKLNLILISLIIIPISVYFYLYSPVSPPKEIIVHTNNIQPNMQENYSAVKDSIEEIRKTISSKYISFSTEKQKNEALQQARLHLIHAVTQCLYPYWEGTPWEFYGTSQIPKQGSIACGYFVTTLLNHAGVKLDRVVLAEVASETMIRKLVSKEKIKVYRNINFDKFLPAFKAQGDGLYLVGLDFHTGFILYENQEVYFIHSSGINPFCVVKEKAEESPLLTYSRYRVTGKISDDNIFLEKWLLGKIF